MTRIVVREGRTVVFDGGEVQPKVDLVIRPRRQNRENEAIKERYAGWRAECAAAGHPVDQLGGKTCRSCGGAL